MKNSILILSLVLWVSCAKRSNTLVADEQFLFGSTYGFCMGKCENNYAIVGGKLYFDTSSKREDYQLAVQSAADYDIAKTVLTLPDYIVQKPNETFGCPDCADQGRLYVTLIKGADTTAWNFDTQAASVPTEIRGYVEKLKMVLSKLRKY